MVAFCWKTESGGHYLLDKSCLKVVFCWKSRVWWSLFVGKAESGGRFFVGKAESGGRFLLLEIRLSLVV